MAAEFGRDLRPKAVESVDRGEGRVVYECAIADVAIRDRRDERVVNFWNEFGRGRNVRQVGREPAHAHRAIEELIDRIERAACAASGKDEPLFLNRKIALDGASVEPLHPRAVVVDAGANQDAVIAERFDCFGVDEWIVGVAEPYVHRAGIWFRCDIRTEPGATLPILLKLGGGGMLDECCTFGEDDVEVCVVLCVDPPSFSPRGEAR